MRKITPGFARWATPRQPSLASPRWSEAGLPSRSSRSERRLERVKGIEPSYSAWKAAALPLSYTRAGDQLSRRASGLNRPAPWPGDGLVAPGAQAALNTRRFASYTEVSINNERR